MSHYKPYPVSKDSGVVWLGWVPENWTIGPYKAMIQIENGSDYKAVEADDGYPVIGSGGPFAFSSKLMYEGESVLLGRKGTIDKPLYINGAFWAVDTMYWSIIKPGVHGRFAYYIATTIPFDMYSTNTALPSMTKGLLGSHIVAFPQFEEQQAIATHLDRETFRIDALVEKKTRFIELLCEKRQALITHAVTKGITPNVKMKASGVEWLGEVPEHWDVVQLRHKAKLESGHTPSRSHPEYWIDCDTPWFTLADVWQVRSGESKFVYDTSEKVSQLGLEKSSARLLPAGSVFLSRTASVGFSGIMGVDMATSQDFAVWTCDNSLNNEFLYYILRGMKGEFDRLMMGSTHKTIYMPDIEALRVARPPLEEQKLIVEFLSVQFQALSKIIDKSKLSLSLLKERRSALITAAVTGQIDLRETE
ncbi:restriction endonuclease subunit S [Pseudomonas sp.]|uniref:restriction endonuclease subunit S n=1 Tax=Pseudomonas sp. TaxID=306 RepID=UPI003266BBD4